MIAEWFVKTAAADGRFDVEVTDLAELSLPLRDKPMHAGTRQYAHEHTKRWRRIVDASDAVVLVVPMREELAAA